MSYTKHTWENDELITAAKMNNIEEGIAGGVPFIDFRWGGLANESRMVMIGYGEVIDENLLQIVPLADADGTDFGGLESIFCGGSDGRLIITGYPVPKTSALKLVLIIDSYIRRSADVSVNGNATDEQEWTLLPITSTPVINIEGDCTIHLSGKVL